MSKIRVESLSTGYVASTSIGTMPCYITNYWLDAFLVSSTEKNRVVALGHGPQGNFGFTAYPSS